MWPAWGDFPEAACDGAFFSHFSLSLSLSSTSSSSQGDPSGILACFPVQKVLKNQTPRYMRLLSRRAGNLEPEEVLHVGDSLRKDCIPAKSLRMHALLLDRFKFAEVQQWGESGALVLPDLVAAQEWLLS